MEEELLNAVEFYLKTKESINIINEMVAPPFPVKPIACTIDEWKEYKLFKDEYDNVVKLKSINLKNLEKDLEENIKHIIKTLPSSNTWFIIDNGKLAIGHRTDDWPSSFGDILIVNNPKIEELQELRHRVIN